MSSSSPADIRDRAADLVMQIGRLLESASRVGPLIDVGDRAALMDVCDTLHGHAQAVAEHARTLPVSFHELLADTDDHTLQTLLGHIPVDRLALALRGEDPALRARAHDNLSARAALMLDDEMDVMPLQRRGDIRAAQHQIVIDAVELARRGQITLSFPEARHG